MNSLLADNPATFPQEEFEQETLGLLMLEPENVDAVRHMLEAKHFEFEAHRDIYDEMLRLRDEGKHANPVTMRAWADNHYELQEVGPYSGARYLVFCVVSRVGWIKPIDAATGLIEQYNLRAARLAADDLAENLKSGFEPEKAAARARASLEEITSPAMMDTVGMGDVAQRAGAAGERARRGDVSALSTRLNRLDKVTGGFHAGDMIVMAGRPGMGKSLLAQHIMTDLAIRSVPSAFKSCEMSLEQIGHRAIAAQCKVPYHKLRVGDLTDYEADLRDKAIKSIANRPIYIDASGASSIADIHSWAKRLVDDKGVQILVIDHLQLLRPGTRYEGSKVAEIEEISGALKRLAVSLNIPVIVISQLSREVESRNDNRPQLFDLRWSGAIEQDADLVMLLYRHSYYNAGEKVNELDVAVAKNRGGETGTVTLHAEMDTGVFADIERVNYDG